MNDKKNNGEKSMRSLDDLDKKIILQLSNGITSYANLAESCGVGRNTINRRIKRLVAEDIIDKKVRAIPNFTKMARSAISVMLEIPQSEVDKVITFLNNQKQVKFLWRTFGTYNVVAVILCTKGEEGNCISKLKTILEKMKVNPKKFETAISYSWEKIDFSPF
jgi:DNA-binding Lrp family transcriptional regulator